MNKIPLLFTLLGEPVRWRVVKALADSDLTIRELARRVGQPLNLMSYHLGLLRDAGLVATRRSSLDGRATYCSLEVGRLTALYAAAGQALHPALGRPGIEADRPLRVLFLCTHNAARSQMAEGLLRALAPGWAVASAGSAPSGVHELAVTTLARRGIDIGRQTSKDVTALGGREFDVVISLCDRVRGERVRLSGRPRRAHWSLPDPLDEPRRAQPKAFRETAAALDKRLRWFLTQHDALIRLSHTQEVS